MKRWIWLAVILATHLFAAVGIPTAVPKDCVLLFEAILAVGGIAWICVWWLWFRNLKP